MKVAYCDCFSGISGDMFLGALVDAGLPVDVLNAQIARLNMPERPRVCVSTVMKGPLRAAFAEVVEDHDHDHNHSHSHHSHSHDHNAADAHSCAHSRNLA
ncbi:MAG: nickel insertion protein, partial [Anaerolineae bacterium]